MVRTILSDCVHPERQCLGIRPTDVYNKMMNFTKLLLTVFGCVALLRMMYVLPDKVTDERIDRARHRISLIRKVPGLWYIIVVPSFIYFLLLLILVAGAYSGFKFNERTRIVQGSVGSLYLLVEFKLLRRLLEYYLIEQYGIRKGVFIISFDFLLVVPLVVIAIIVHLFSAINVQEKSRRLREYVDVFVGVLCWTYIPLIIFHLYRWILAFI